jgi:histidine triad (HIT) family protein
MASIFTRIVQAEIPAFKFAEDERFLAFLDINTVEKGHNLVIPKQQNDYIFDLDPQTLADLMRFSQRVAKAIKAVVPCKRIGITVIGLEVPHAHVHLVPLIRQNFIDFSDKIEISKEDLAALSREISEKVR